ncbi:MAG: lipopolysaccharide biosynthesis protein [Flavobacteriaceae bacterium]|jgi:O-antigen/teichoic acid export membrane protein|nr:lipopolysaccharide biosynthesis protein [Flavobacteriaceae bacterium]
MTTKAADNKRIVKNSSILLIRLILMMGITFYSSRILLRELGINDYGLYGVIGGVVAMFGSLRGIFASSIQRFLNYEMGKGSAKELNKVFSTGVIIHILLSLFFLIVAEIVGLWFLNYKLVIDPDRYNAANWVFQFSVFTSIITILTIPYDAVIIANERMKAFAYISILDAILKLIVILLLSYSNNDKLIFYAFLLFIISIIIRTISWRYCVVNFEESRFKFIWNKKMLTDIGTFAGWNFLGNTAQTFSNEGLNIMLNIFGGTTVNAARSIAYQIRSVTMQFLSNILLAVNPHMIKLYSKKKEEDFMKLMFFVSKTSFYVIFIIVVPFVFFSETLLSFWLINVPPLADIFVKLILMYLLVRSFHSPIDTLFKATGEIRNYQIVDSVTLFLTLPISYVLLRNNYSVSCVFIVMFFVECLNLMCIVFLAYKMKKLEIGKYISKVILPCFKVSILCIPLCYFLIILLSERMLMNSLLVLMIVSISNVLGILLLGFNSDEKKVLLEKAKDVNKIFK